ncbi:acetyl-CoA synthetase-like protein [Tilletiaria anomala UBC 951]|uniref:Acetyl-CoA synthetase-like protein n=1 Tax=Tilletiaria anomala (strain ATCC 24038 / CBS 436.72 / UBC 951) TaxID=1037660 RepID=A0A066V8S2_TILAU|nr:acetyl-CoA synthetase-like protein [Tilletiaria anomala UBC 951]KDN38147.1 acetyl-CoA synthetase-like protein [Tilletiaria anomala UBC 951]
MPIIDKSKDLDALFREQVRVTPDAIALEDRTSSYTYAALDAKVGTLAARFRTRNVGPCSSSGKRADSLVGVLLSKSADYVITCLAAHRAGGAFLVLELAYPPSLLAEVIQDAKPAVVVTSPSHSHLMKDIHDVPIITLGERQTDELQPATTNDGVATAVVGACASSAQYIAACEDENNLSKLAFVSYSSGTTGKPKGIANPHQAAVYSYDARFSISDVKPGDRVACNVYFIWEILRPLLRGATVFAVPDDSSYDPIALVDLLSERNVTETLMTPTLLAAVLARHAKLGSKLPKLRTLWLNGEVVTTDLARRALKALPNVRVLNCYSASETHEIACGDINEMLQRLDPDAAYCPVGPPVDATHTYVLDEEGKCVEPGTSGELFVGGDFLARGYLNRPETTANAFLEDRFDPGEGNRMYRTGDLARIIPETGLLEITGRVGGMIKIRGYTIIPGKVENAIVDSLRVSNCAILANGDGLERQLVAYVVREDAKCGDETRQDFNIDENGHSPVARHALGQHLAHYMLPTLWIELDHLPTNQVSGKVDLKNLPAPATAIAAANAARQRGKADAVVNSRSIAKMWAVSLNITPEAILEAGPNVSFFDLGGHSLSLASLATRISKSMGGFAVPLAKLAGAPTLEGHVQAVLDARDGHIAAVQADLPAILAEDSHLADGLAPSSARCSMCRIEDADTILLTGVTGFLGGNLLHDILKNTSARVICPIRFDTPYRTDRSAAMARLRSNLLDMGLWHESVLDRVDVVPSNLSRHRLGLLPEVYDELASTVQVVVHCAAQVNLVYPYAALRDPNVKGTLEIIRFACQSNATLQYVSTNGVLPPSQVGWPEDAMTSIEDVPKLLLDGYCQTKWVAEHLVLQAGRRGLPAHIYRVGTLSGHSQTGSANTYDLLTALIVESLHLGAAPELEGWHAEMTPVDFVSKAIIALSNHEEPGRSIYHVGDPHPIDCRLLFDRFEALGYPTERMSWDAWVALWHEKRGNAKGGNHGFTVDILRTGMPSKDTLFEITALRDDATRVALGDLRRPAVDVDLLRTYSRHWYARGWLHRQPLRAPTKADNVNGVKANGVKANGVKENGVKANGVKANGVKANGVKASGVKANGINGTFDAALIESNHDMAAQRSKDTRILELEQEVQRLKKELQDIKASR